MAGLYVHIPFCKSRCIYCGFYSTVGKADLADRYVDCLLKELKLRAASLKGERVTTIYIGGGTPSVLTTKQLEQLVEGIYHILSINPAAIEEFTVECNPDDVTPSLAMSLKALGVNRVSMGVQTFSDERLRFIHRRHTSQQIPLAVESLRQTGIRNISIDLMFGFPGFDRISNNGETIADWEEDIDKTIALNVEHLSAYSLMWEEGTPLYRMMEKGGVKPIDEELSRQMFEMLMDKMESAGYEHYEISNFARPGYRSKHNSSYWHDVPYIGIGASAHSYDRLTRQWNIADIKDYIDSIESGVIPCEKEDIDTVTHYNDIVTTALRTKEGIDLRDIEKQFQNYLIDNAQMAIDCGNLVLEDNHIHLTRQGIYISDDIMSDLIMV